MGCPLCGDLAIICHETCHQVACRYFVDSCFDVTRHWSIDDFRWRHGGNRGKWSHNCIRRNIGGTFNLDPCFHTTLHATIVSTENIIDRYARFVGFRRLLIKNSNVNCKLIASCGWSDNIIGLPRELPSFRERLTQYLCDPYIGRVTPRLYLGVMLNHSVRLQLPLIRCNRRAFKLYRPDKVTPPASGLRVRRASWSYILA